MYCVEFGGVVYLVGGDVRGVEWVVYLVVVVDEGFV